VFETLAIICLLYNPFKGIPSILTPSQRFFIAFGGICTLEQPTAAAQYKYKGAAIELTEWG
jgi:hypothetical protein